MRNKFLLAYVKSLYLYKDIKSIKDISENDKRIFTHQLKELVEKYEVKDIKRQIRNASRVTCGFEADI